jgi:hypothetical protein
MPATEHTEVDEAHKRPDNTTDDTIAAVGKVTEALEWIERARGHLYEFHQLIGHADLLFGDAADALDKAGHIQQAADIRRKVVGRNILDGRWTFQIVEEFEGVYYAAVKDTEKNVRDTLVDGKRHIYESEMKERRRTPGEPGHECRP